jgi:glycosyltransferase involved in cell wall biosynthesis
VSVIYNGLDHRIFYPRGKQESREKLGLPQDKLIILHLGSEITRKQVPLLLRSFKEIKRKYPNALLVRHGEKKEATQKLINDLGLENDIVYYGYTDEANLPYFYSAADVLVQPSSEEGFCFPVIEAMACGLPVVATNRASLPEVCGGAEASLILELTESGVFSALDFAICLSPSEKSAVVEKGIKNAARFSWEEAAMQVYRVYQSIQKNK